MNQYQYSNNITDFTKLGLPELYEYIKNLQDTVVTLLDANKKLKEQNEELSKKRDNCLDSMALDILEYFDNCKSIRETAENYDMTTEEVIHWIPYWDDCTDGLQSAIDYKDFVKDDENEDSD